MALQDPAGAVPEPDAAGRIVLTETKTVAAGAAIGLLVACGMAVLSVWFFASLWAGTLAPGWYLWLRVIAWIGLIFLPAIPWMLLNLLYLRRLVIDDGGITDRMGGRVRHMAWGEIRRIERAGGGDQPLRRPANDDRCAKRRGTDDRLAPRLRRGTGGAGRVPVGTAQPSLRRRPGRDGSDHDAGAATQVSAGRGGIAGPAGDRRRGDQVCCHKALTWRTTAHPGSPPARPAGAPPRPSAICSSG